MLCVAAADDEDEGNAGERLKRSTSVFTQTPHLQIGLVGCSHGALNSIYEQAIRQGVDVLLCCGDFQTIRNRDDLNCMACPAKYASFGDFHEYFEGRRVAPCLTLFIGGNHEASEFLQQM